MSGCDGPVGTDQRGATEVSINVIGLGAHGRDPGDFPLTRREPSHDPWLVGLVCGACPTYTSVKQICEVKKEKRICIVENNI